MEQAWCISHGDFHGDFYGSVIQQYRSGYQW